MGDRALVIFADNTKVSPTVYLHWSGTEVPRLLISLREFMKGREGDVDYAAARFVGLCHEYLKETNLSLGILNTPENIEKAVTCVGHPDGPSLDAIKEYSHGDAGVVVVNVSDFSWKAYGGYLAVQPVPITGMASRVV